MTDLTDDELSGLSANAKALSDGIAKLRGTDAVSVQKSPETERARRGIGLAFVDILYGLAATQVFRSVQSASSPKRISAVGWAYLAVVLALIVLSYVGYHINRVDRNGGWPLGFLNLPFLELAIDVVLVGTYFVMVAEAPGVPTGTPPTARPPSAFLFAILVAVVFGLYLVWDLVDHVIMHATKDDKPCYPLPSDPADRKSFKTCETVRWSVVFLVLVLALLWVVAWQSPTDTECLLLVFGIYLVVFIVYRLYPGTTTTRPPTPPPPT